MKLKRIAVGVAVAMAGATSAAQADSILFPYVVSGDSVTTVVSVISGPNYVGYNSAGQAGQGDRLHWTMVNKAGAAAESNSAVCSEVNYYLPSSKNDIQTVDLGARVSGEDDSGVLFNDPSINNNWRDQLGNLTYALADEASQGSGLRGYLMVDEASGEQRGQLSGEAFVFEFGSGAAWGYRAIPSQNADFYFAHASMAPSAQVAFMPLAETDTRFFVTPLNRTGVPADMDPTDNGNGNFERLTSTITMRTASGLAFDRDENLVSGSREERVTCVGAVNLPDLMSPGARSVLRDGGWGKLRIVSTDSEDDGSTTSNANVIKLEFNASGRFNDKPMDGVYNNATTL